MRALQTNSGISGGCQPEKVHRRAAEYAESTQSRDCSSVVRGRWSVVLILRSQNLQIFLPPNHLRAHPHQMIIRNLAINK